MEKYTTVDYHQVKLDNCTVILYDAEEYGARVLRFDSEQKAEQCYKDTVAILIEAHNKLTIAGWSQAVRQLTGNT